MSRGPLRGVRRVDDAGTHWHAVLVCGHSAYRPKTTGRLTVFSRCHCPDCHHVAAAPAQSIPPAMSPTAPAENRTDRGRRRVIGGFS